jgi:L-rhamnose mutarotase
MRAKDFIPASKPRNFVAKNSKTAGAGAHKDKKRAAKQGDVKHKQKQFEQGVAEDWKSKVAGAALAGAAALGGGAQASEPVTPLAVMATVKMKLPDGSIKTIKKDLGHSYDYRLDDARTDLENLLDRKGIKNYTIHLDRYKNSDADATAPKKTKDYMDKTPAIGKADDNKNYMDKGPYTANPSKTTYLDKSTGKEFRDMDNY